MKGKLNTIRIKLILTYLLSAVLAGTFIFILFMAVSISFYYKYDIFLKWVDTHLVMLFFTILILFILLMSGFFLLFTQKGIKYLENIIQLVDEIAKGNLGVQIPVERTDELGNLSRSVNTMSKEIKRLIEEEQSWEKGKDDMVSSISHDLRTPLTSVLGYLQLIIKYEQSGNEEYMLRYADIAYTKCMELKLLIDQLFEYANVSNKEFKLNKTIIDITELIRQVILGIMPALKENNLSCREKFPDEKILIFADAVLMARVFDNLISNAIKYGNSGKYIDIELEKDHGEAVVKISNYGNSIPQSDLPYIFDKFYSVDKSRSGSTTGAGLGLAIVKSIIERHDGEIRVNSNDNKTVFEVQIKTC